MKQQDSSRSDETDPNSMRAPLSRCAADFGPHKAAPRTLQSYPRKRLLCRRSTSLRQARSAAAPRAPRRLRGLFFAALLCSCAAPALAAELTQTIERIKPAVVGIGTSLKTRNPAVQFFGTGFAVADGRHVITNAHVVARPLDTEKKETPIVLVARDGEPQPQVREAEILAVDKDHDLALLRIAGAPLPALKLGDSAAVREGQTLALTGFPIGMVLGFHPATHRAMVAAITPVALPGITARQLNPRVISRIRDSVYSIFQLDGTAFPGNSGSPLYDPADGVVYGIINSVFVQGTRESAISRPSGISYAIPSRYMRELLQREKIAGFE